LETARRKRAVEKDEKVKRMQNILILKPIRNARKTAGGALVALLTMSAVSDGPLAHGAPVESTKPGVLASEVGKAEKPSLPPVGLYGTWIAKGVVAKIGEVRIRLTFRREKKVSVLAWSDIPFAGQVRNLQGPFSVDGDKIKSKAIRDGEKATFSFEGKQLVLRFKSGKVVRFDRE
jgi:hypothetical protein